MKEVIGFKASACSSVQIPRHSGVILPLASTADASANPVYEPDFDIPSDSGSDSGSDSESDRNGSGSEPESVSGPE